MMIGERYRSMRKREQVYVCMDMGRQEKRSEQLDKVKISDTENNF